MPHRQWEVIGVYDIPTTTLGELNTYDVPVEDRIHVKQDCFGFSFPNGYAVFTDRSSLYTDDRTIALYNRLEQSQIRKGAILQVHRDILIAFSLDVTVESGKYFFFHSI